MPINIAVCSNRQDLCFSQGFSLESPLGKKTFSVPSTVDSPLLMPGRSRLDDFDSSYELIEEELPQ
jgi:hypothetical protein